MKYGCPVGIAAMWCYPSWMRVAFEKLAKLNVARFQWIESQTSELDRLGLLSVQEALCSTVGRYRYLEVGSHLGGSLQPHVSDARCVSIASIDSRPLEQPDERWAENYRYDGNSTARMLEQLALVPGADLGKIQTFEATAQNLPSASIPFGVHFAFIDGEHTNVAVVRDFQSVRQFLSETSVMVFHDCFVTPRAFRKIRRRLFWDRESHAFLYFPESNLVAIAFGSVRAELLSYGWQTKPSVSAWLKFWQSVTRNLARAVTAR